MNKLNGTGGFSVKPEAQVSPESGYRMEARELAVFRISDISEVKSSDGKYINYNVLGFVDDKETSISLMNDEVRWISENAKPGDKLVIAGIPSFSKVGRYFVRAVVLGFYTEVLETLTGGENETDVLQPGRKSPSPSDEKNADAQKNA